MADSSNTVRQTRRTPRLKVPPMYTLIRVRQAGKERYQWTGHIYDISTSGMRFELDQPIDPGTEVEVRAMLPGHEHTTVHAAGRVVRLHDDESVPGPIRMGLDIERFQGQSDQIRLQDYIARASRAAA